MLRVFKVTGHSLTGRLENGDFIITSKIPIWLSHLKRGDLVAFLQPGYGLLVKQIQEFKPARKELWVIGSHPDSSGSAQFGPVPLKSVLGKVIWIARKPNESDRLG